MNNLCEHYECRCIRSHELARLCELTGNNRYLAEALKVWDQRVQCRKSMPRDGPYLIKRPES